MNNYLSFFKNNHPTGIEISDTEINAIEIKESFLGFGLETFGTVQIDEGLIEKGKIKSIKRLSEALKILFNAYSFKQKNIALSLSGHFLFLKKFISENNLFDEDNIHAEAEKIIPFELKKFYLDFNVIDKTKKIIIIAGIKKDIADSYIEAIKEAGLILRSINSSTISLFNIYEFNYGIDEHTEVILNISYDKIFIDIVKNGFPLFFREIFQKEKDSYEYIKETLDFFIAENSEESINKIILNGKDSETEHIKDILSKKYHLVEHLYPLKKIKINKKKFSPSYIKLIETHCAICAGAAITKI